MEEEGSLTVTKKQLASLWPYFTVISGTQDLIGAMGQSALATGGLACVPVLSRARARAFSHAACVTLCRVPLAWRTSPVTRLCLPFSSIYLIYCSRARLTVLSTHGWLIAAVARLGTPLMGSVANCTPTADCRSPLDATFSLPPRAS